jgi:hypothetical protein
MLLSSRLMVYLIMLFVFCQGVCPASMALAWTLRFAPLHHTTGDTAAFTPSTSMPVMPQFLRILITGKQVIIGVEAPYLRAIKLVPPIRFEQRSRSTSQPAANTYTLRPRHHLRSPETFLLRRPQTVVGKTWQ